MGEEIDKIEKQELEFLNKLEKKYNRLSIRALLGRPRYLWLWQKNISLKKRWEAILNNSSQLRSLLTSRKCNDIARDMAILDLGCGFGMYWPVFMQFGFRNFVGIDLFDLRKREKYFDAAKEFVTHFCEGCKVQLIMNDVRNIDNHKLIFDKFDIVLAVATASAKLGSTAIPKDLFNKISDKYGKKDCIRIYVKEI